MGQLSQSKIGRYEFMAEPFHCDFTCRLFMAHLGNHLLNAADFHSAHRGFGIPTLQHANKTWVLSRLAIEMTEMPRQYEAFVVETWIESVMRYFTNRNFRITDTATGRTLGYARSVWALIDTASRQPLDILNTPECGISSYIEPSPDCPIDRLSRVKIGDRAQLAGEIEVRYSDLDINGHVNSIKYLEHVLDLFEPATYKNRRISRIDIAYVAESRYGDRLAMYGEQAGREHLVRVVKNGDTEVCRCKIRFE